MFHRENEVLKYGTGIAVPGATVTVYRNGTDTAGDYTHATKQTIYSDAAGLDVILNSAVVADSNGHYEYFIADGIYDEVLSYGAVTMVDDYLQMFDLSESGQAVANTTATDAAALATAKANAAAASATAAATSETNAANSAASAAAAAASVTAGAAAAAAASTAAIAAGNTATDAASQALTSENNAAASAAFAGSVATWPVNFAANGDYYIPANVDLAFVQAQPPIGTGTLAYARSTPDAPAVFTTLPLPLTCQAGSWLRVRASGVAGFLAASLKAGTASISSNASPLKTIISIGTDTNTAPSNTLTRYTPPCGGGSINSMWNSSTSMPRTPVVVQGTISNLMARLENALAAGTSWTFTLVKNGVDTALSVTIDSTGKVQFDNAHTVSVVPGDDICFKSAPTNTPTAQLVVQIACLFTTNSGAAGPLFAIWAGSASGTGWGTVNNINSSSQAELSRRAYMPTGGSITAMTISTNTAPGGTETRSVTIVKNGVDVGTATITGAATTATWSGNVAFVAGDKFQLRKDASAAAASGFTAVGMDWNPVTPGETFFLAPGTGNFDSTTTIYQNLNGTAENNETVEAHVYTPIPVPCTISQWRADCGTAPGAGKTRTFTMRKNGADAAGPITISGTATTGSASPGLACVAGDLLDWKEVPSGNPAASNPCGASAVVVVS